MALALKVVLELTQAVALAATAAQEFLEALELQHQVPAVAAVVAAAVLKLR